jgi:hypothetical protein
MERTSCMPPRHPKRILGTVFRHLVGESSRGRVEQGPSRPPAAAARRIDPSSIAKRRDLDSFRRAQGTPYWHHDHRAS